MSPEPKRTLPYTDIKDFNNLVSVQWEMKQEERVERTGGWWQEWVLGLPHVKCLRERSVVLFLLCMSQIWVLECSALQASTPADLLLLTAGRCEHL